MEMMQFERNRPTYQQQQHQRLIQRTASSDVASDDQYKSLDRFGSIDSEDTFLSCNTHPFPSQGSLAGLEELAAVGSMAPNGSMPAVNIPSFNNNATGYANPFDPNGQPTRGQQRRRGSKQIGGGQPVQPRGRRDRGGTLTPSPQGSPMQRRVRIAGNRSASSDAELDWDPPCHDQMLEEAFYVEDSSAPKHKRARVSQVRNQFDTFVKKFGEFSPCSILLKIL
jgi:hypothetical protein